MMKIIDENGVKDGHLFICQVMGTMLDGKIMMAVGRDEMSFNVEDGDRFYTAIFVADPFIEPVDDGDESEDDA